MYNCSTLFAFKDQLAALHLRPELNAPVGIDSTVIMSWSQVEIKAVTDRNRGLGDKRLHAFRIDTEGVQE
jgi:hypothetical protein